MLLWTCLCGHVKSASTDPPMSISVRRTCLSLIVAGPDPQLVFPEVIWLPSTMMWRNWVISKKTRSTTFKKSVLRISWVRGCVVGYRFYSQVVLQSSSKANVVLFCFIFAILQLYLSAPIQCSCMVTRRADVPYTPLFVWSECPRPMPSTTSDQKLCSNQENRSLLGLGGWGVNDRVPITSLLPPSVPLLLHFFLVIFLLSWSSMSEAVLLRMRNGLLGTSRISILAFQGWSTPNHHAFIIKSLKNPPQTT